MWVSQNTKQYLDDLEQRVDRRVAKADIPFLENVPDAYDIEDCTVEDEFAVFKNNQLQQWYIDEAGGGGESYNPDFYISMMIGLDMITYQSTLTKEYGANLLDGYAYFKDETDAVNALGWVASMRTLARISETDIITFEK